MSFTTTQKLQIKKFLGLPPKDKFIDSYIANVEDGAEIEAEVVAAITACQTAFDAWQTTLATQDNLIEAGSPNGGVAKFALGVGAGFSKKAYDERLKELARLLDIPGWDWWSGGANIIGVCLT
jgi:hypothetical protein